MLSFKGLLVSFVNREYSFQLWDSECGISCFHLLAVIIDMYCKSHVEVNVFDCFGVISHLGETIMMLMLK